MVYSPGLIKPRTRDLTQARKWAIGLILAAPSARIVVAELERIKELLRGPLGWGYLGLLVVVGTLILAWIWATDKEYSLMVKWLDPECYEPPSSLHETLLIIGLGLSLIGLLFAARNPFWFGIAFTVYSLASPYGMARFNGEFRSALLECDKRLNEDRRNPILRPAADQYGQGLDVLRAYYFDRPQMRRQYVVLASAVLGLLLAIYWRVTSIAWIGLAAYCGFALTIIVSEFQIGLWRIDRDSRLRPIMATIRSMRRSGIGTENASGADGQIDDLTETDG
jgi:hypothetical protein